MSRSADEYSNISLLLSDVLDDIGVDEDTVNKRREHWSLFEAYNDVSVSLITEGFSTGYHFGSQSEGSTTFRLQSDFDQLRELKDPVVIEDSKFWQAGRNQLLMIRNESVTPGYCLLQAMRTDVPQPEQNLDTAQWRIKEHPIITANSFKEEQGMILLQNGAFEKEMDEGTERNGPAFTWPGTFTSNETDIVLALKCDQWPRGARIPVDEQNPHKWPTIDMKREAESTGCFVIAVAGKESQYKDFEWRISTAKAERILMVSLNVIQLKCFVLLKFVLKTYIHPKCGKVLTSYMCKHVLFHQVKRGQENWQKHTLFACLKSCIIELHSYVKQKFLPRFIMPDDNLMRGKVTEKEQNQVLKVIENLIEMDIDILSAIEFEDLGLRLRYKVGQNPIGLSVQTHGQVSYEDIMHLQTKEEMSHVNDITMKMIQGQKFAQTAINIISSTIKGETTLHQILHRYKSFVDIGNTKQRKACKELIPIVKSTIGCIEASDVLVNMPSVSEDILEKWFPDHIKEDNIWSCLKKASVFYCSGRVQQAENILQEVNKHFDANNIQTLCRCKNILIDSEKLIFILMSIARSNNSFFTPCMIFLPEETNCIPKELQYEINRSFNEDITKILQEGEYWKLRVNVDVSHFLYFLQFKIYQQLERPNEKNRALKNLQKAIASERHSCHTETAYNLLGQCLEEENRMDEAMECYGKSFNVWPEYNIAMIHACKLLCKVIHNKKLGKMSSGRTHTSGSNSP
ncbi:hypothetical protein ACF0H5_003060 [Mactra antiquata]